MNMKSLAKIAVVAFVASITFAFSAEKSVSIHGAGATFPYPLYAKWFSEFGKVDPTSEINYQSIGSGGGIRQLLESTIDFGASDSPMKDEELAKAKMPIYHFPTTMGAVVLTYNLPGLNGVMKLSPEALAEIFLGKITTWNDPKLKALNTGMNLPETPIIVVHRADGSGTSAVFTDYLSKISPDWKAKVGTGTSVSWPTGVGGKGNEGVTGFVKQSAGAIGYVELAYAEQNKLAVALLQNSSGQFIKPSPESVTEAANGALKTIPADFRVSITNSPGKKAYPISSFTYLLFYEKMPAPISERMKKFLEWALKDGQKFAPGLSYAPLPASLVVKVKAQIAKLKSADGSGSGK